MESFLINCPHCGVMTARDLPCPSCRGSVTGEASPSADSGDTVREFSRRRKVHLRNYGVFMTLQMLAGFVGLVTTVMWFLVIRRGNLIAFATIGLMTILSAVLAGLLFCAKKYFPTDLLCPSCDVQLDQLSTIGEQCPSCYTQLKG